MSEAPFAVHWSATAEKDLVIIANYIASDNIDAALQQVRMIKNACRTLASFPKRCRIVPELRAFGIVFYRDLVVRPYRIQFRIDAQNVYVLSVLDSRRNLEDILLERFLDDPE